MATTKPLSPDDPVTALKGVGSARAEALGRLGISSIRDLLFHFPRAYENRGRIRTLADGTDGVTSSFLLRVESQPRTVKVRGGMMITTFRAADVSGTVEVVYFNQEYVGKQIEYGRLYRFWGRMHRKGGRWQMPSPAFDPAEGDVVLPDFVPRYPLCDKITDKILHGLILSALDLVGDRIADPLPEDLRLKRALPTIGYALREIHLPTTEEKTQLCLRRAAYDELLCMAIGIGQFKRENETTKVNAFFPCDTSPLLSRLPYRLTNAQKRVMEEITSDMCTADGSGLCTPMRRIIIGDVGSGKTVCAALAAYITAKNGAQTALMVPTTILAIQHFEDLGPLFAACGLTVRLLTGATPAKEKRKIYDELSGAGEHVDLVIGTHALLREGLVFENLGLVITDEQHRFGVLQRAALREKTERGHLLVMSATPIPRTLALSMYGDLSVSMLDEMPPGRQRVDTYAVDETYRERLHAFLRKQVEQGGQAYVVCPAIRHDDAVEDEEELSLGNLFSRSKEPKLPLRDAVGYADDLSKDVFPDLRIGLLHGQMKNAEKDRVMQAFSCGEIDILVSTTVIEVGVNVPNATVMMIENAERFGLSQLHQLRGRVGRGKKKSYCVLVSDSHAETACERLKTMTECYNGFEIAEKDLQMRGPGDFFADAAAGNVRQSGGLPLRMAAGCSDLELLRAAFADATSLLSLDPGLDDPVHRLLKKEVERVFTLDEKTVS